MQQPIHFEPHSHLSRKPIRSYPVCKMNTSLYNTTKFAANSSFIHSSLLLSHQTQMQNSIFQTPVICARRSKRRNGSQRSTRFILQLITTMASKLKILPQPLDLVIAEIGGGDGNGGGFWFWKVFGGGGFDGWRRRRKRNRNLLILGFLAICGLGFLFGKELQLQSNVLGGVLGFGLIGSVLIQWCENRGAKDWIFGFCVGGVLMGLGLRKEEMQKWVEKFRVCSPIMQVKKLKKKSW
ncbi:hypothetical protein SO802_000547 [Lithocarpus litseifolius]|uniref:Transmembrane protein n=1 Tax=Lithocarpus litseifolius TaxID=425828 RepID=A0AAW2DVA5_9ROSI